MAAAATATTTTTTTATGTDCRRQRTRNTATTQRLRRQRILGRGTDGWYMSIFAPSSIMVIILTSFLFFLMMSRDDNGFKCSCFTTSYRSYPDNQNRHNRQRHSIENLSKVSRSKGSYIIESQSPSTASSSTLWSFFYDPNQGSSSSSSSFPSPGNHDGDDNTGGYDDSDRNSSEELVIPDSASPLPPSSNSQQQQQPTPIPSLSAIDVATLCMDALQNEALPQTSLGVCFEFSSDRCRAAVGGTLDEFVKYASNPVFGTLVHCEDYRILSVGPIIPGSQHRGEMQTILIEITQPMTVRDAVSEYNTAKREVEQRQQDQQQSSYQPTKSTQRASGRPTIEERMRAREQRKRQQPDGVRSFSSSFSNDRKDVATSVSSNGQNASNKSDNTRVFLWTMQKERRPPRQDCWLVHEVLHKQYAFQLTT